jgi:hypothetical protein
MHNLAFNRPQINSFVSKAAKILILVVIIFGLTIFFITRDRIDKYTRNLNVDLTNIYRDGITVRLPIDQTIPIELSIPIGDLVDISSLIPNEIPISANVPIKTSVRINQTVRVPINLPLLGRTVVDIPINTVVPIEENIAFDTTIKIDSSAFKTPDSVINIDQDIAFSAPISLNITLEDLGLQSSFQDLTALINTLRFAFLLGRLELAP